MADYCSSHSQLIGFLVVFFLGWVVVIVLTFLSHSAFQKTTTGHNNGMLDTFKLQNGFKGEGEGGGDMTILYDVLTAFETHYMAQVTITNHNPTHRIDKWRLKWEWTRQEFIYSIRGAYPTLVEQRGCIFGPQGNFYKDLDFSNVVNCQTTPEFADLPPNLANDPTKGASIPFCCRNGTILPPSIDLASSVSAFQLQVYKMPPHLNHSYIVPPQNWQLTGAFSVRYQCQHPMLVEPTTFHDMSSGLRTNKLAIVTWAVPCSKENQTTSSSRRCCLSYSTFNSDSAIPCPTCACGCPPSPVQTCTASASALPLPSSALMLPFQHRMPIMKAWAELKHIRVPNPTPCGDNCGINIHWHISSDYEQGWIGRVTIFNWESAGIANWFLTMQLDNAAVGIQKVYSFNSTFLEGIENTIFMHGLPGLNYIIGEKVGDNPDKDPRIPGTQQTVIKFSKRRIPGINVLDGDGFPTKVTFNGEECSLPQTLPRPDPRRSAAGIFTALICLFLIIIAVLLCVRILS